MTSRKRYYLLPRGRGDLYAGIHSLEEARGKAAELGGIVDIFSHVETVTANGHHKDTNSTAAPGAPGREAR